MKLSSEQKKELQEQYRQMKAEMGILAVINKDSGKYFLETTPNLKAMTNRISFQLKNDSHIHKELQRDWQELGAQQFEVKILEILEYDEDESKTDYSEELELLKMIWVEKLIKEDIELY